MTQQITLASQSARDTAKRMIDRAPPRAVVKIAEERRSNAQNDLMWELLGRVSRAKPEGRVLPPEVWKCVFMASVGHQCRFEPSLDGSTVVPIGFKSSRLRKSEMSDLIESIMAYAAEHGVELG